jgi:hypothetical protein
MPRAEDSYRAQRNEWGGTCDVRIRAANLRWQTPGERLALHKHGTDLMGSDP